jgi:chromosome segregation ATPase
MPPKKKKGKGKKGSAKKKSAGRQREKPGVPEVLPELSKQFYLVQIEDLEKRIRRYQEKCDQLELKSRDLEAEVKRMEETRHDMSKLFNKQLEERATRVANLEETGEALDQQLRAEREEYEAQIKSMRETAQLTRDQLRSEITILRSNLDSLDEFRLRKEEIETEMADLRRQLEQKDQHHEEVLYELERKTVQDKNRMKRELEQRLNDVATEFRRVSNKQMAETTKRTLRDNIRYSNQLGEMSGKTEDLLQQNETLKKKEKEYRLKIGILEENEKELAKKHLSSKKNNECVRLLSMELQL